MSLLPDPDGSIVRFKNRYGKSIGSDIVALFGEYLELAGNPQQSQFLGHHISLLI